jgi:hypothetical protein
MVAANMEEGEEEEAGYKRMRCKIFRKLPESKSGYIF